MALFVAEGVVSFAVEKLWDLLSKESERLQGIDDQLEELKRRLRMLESLLKDAEAKKHGSATVRYLMEDVKDIVYDAEDIIESFLLKEFREKEKGIKKHVRRLACFLSDRRKFAKDIEGITKRISEVIGEMQSLGIQQIINGGRSLSMQERQREQREIRQTFAKSSESDLVGVEQSVEELVGQLVENDNIQVVSISGMGGIGKTTLARQVFHHDRVRRHFVGFAWVCVSQEFTQKHVWQQILQKLLHPHDGEILQRNENTLQSKQQELQPHDREILKMDEYALQSKLFQMLETGRYLVVLDDVWKKEDWDRMKEVFPRKRGWKMLLTSRDERVGLHADPKCFVFKPSVLTPEQSWRLCERIAFPRTDETEPGLDEEMAAMGKKMVTYCGGLPLAIKVLGGLLAEKPTFPEWKRVFDNIGAQIVGKSGLDDNNSVNRVLSLSYEDLPMHLKHCFLYLAHFPEDYLLPTEKLFNYWAAEGITTSFYIGSTIRNSGEGYLQELVRRNMVILVEKDLTSTFKCCQMHDMMREVCLSKAKEENFLQIIKIPTSNSAFNAQSPRRSRRIAVHSGDKLEGNNLHHILRRKNNKKVRSLIILEHEESFWTQSASGLRSLPMLRVLDLSKVKFEGGKLPSSIGELIHLRFLRLHEAGISRLPSSLRKLKLLLYLNLGVDLQEPVHVPNVLKEMLELRYLVLPWSMDDKTELELGNLVNLEFLGAFSTQHSRVTDLLRMTKLRILSVSLTGSCTLETLSSSLRELRNLETLALIDVLRSMADSVGEFVMDSIHLKDIVLNMHLPRFPDQFRFPPHLTRIRLGYCRMEEDPMPVLEKLLHLKMVLIENDAFVGRRMVCSKGGFPQLSALLISKQPELEEWIVEEGSMPCLRSLTIKNCEELKELPDGIKYITSLKELKIEGMKREWEEKLATGGEDYGKVQHIPNVQFINCDDE